MSSFIGIKYILKLYIKKLRLHRVWNILKTLGASQLVFLDTLQKIFLLKNIDLSLL